MENICPSHSYVELDICPSHSYVEADICTSHSYVEADICPSHSYVEVDICPSHSYVEVDTHTFESHYVKLVFLEISAKSKFFMKFHCKISAFQLHLLLLSQI